MALFISEEETLALISMSEAIEVVETSLIDLSRGAAEAPPRQRMAVPGGGVYRSMSAVLPRVSAFGTKVGLQQFGFPDGVVKAPVQVLYSSETGDLLALFWSDFLTQLRTAALGGVSARHLANPICQKIAVIGSGNQARMQLRAVVSERPSESVVVYSPNSSNRERFAATMSEELSLEIETCASAAEAIDGATLVVAATNSSKPVFDGEGLTAGTHVISIRSSYAHDIGLKGERREIDDATVRRSDVITVDSLGQARKQRSPEVMPVIDRTVELGMVIDGEAPGRLRPDQTTLFKSFGTSVADIAVAEFVFQRAVDSGVGIELPRPSR